MKDEHIWGGHGRLSRLVFHGLIILHHLSQVTCTAPGLPGTIREWITFPVVPAAFWLRIAPGEASVGDCDGELDRAQAKNLRIL